MKKYFILLLFLTQVLTTNAQTYIRKPGESKESVVAKAISAISVQVGNVYEITDSASSNLIYFEIKPQDTIGLKKTPQEESPLEFGNSKFGGRATFTLFEILHSKDGIHYNRYCIDTLDANSGCCPCHMPDVVDSMKIVKNGNRQDLVLFMQHPVRFDCNSMTNFYTLVYEGFIARIHRNIFAMKPEKIR